VEQASVGQVVDGGHELLARQVSCHAEDDERAGTGDAVQAAVIGVAQGLCPREISTVIGKELSYCAASNSANTSVCGSVRVSVTTGRSCAIRTDASPAACAAIS
jgi:hypothetical protein